MTASANASTTHRFGNVPTAPPDPILGLVEAYEADPRPEKMNLSSGVYKDASGNTPVLACVKEAERRLAEQESTKGYLSIDGLKGYRDHVRRIVFGDSVASERVAVVQAPGGTGGLRIAADFLPDQLGPLRVWLPNPTWANHGSIFAAAGVATDSYRYLSADKRTLDFDGLMSDLGEKAKPGDVVLLHACCHNPTGVDPSDEQWRELAGLLSRRGLLPLVDFAYQGFGRGLEEDASGLREILNVCDEAIVCTSFSKNFGLYSERVGAVSFVAADRDAASAVLSQLKRLVRSNYSNPPRHGASVVNVVLDDAELTRQWHQELTEMRDRIRRLRVAFVEGMKRAAAGHDFSFLLNQNGMFSFSGLTPMQVDELKSRHGVYIVGSGRINVAGISEERIDTLCGAVADVLD